MMHAVPEGRMHICCLRKLLSVYHTAEFFGGTGNVIFPGGSGKMRVSLQYCRNDENDDKIV